jgi:hypothetical protein
LTLFLDLEVKKEEYIRNNKEAAEKLILAAEKQQTTVGKMLLQATDQGTNLVSSVDINKT